jgi:hypothetical protein
MIFFLTKLCKKRWKVNTLLKLNTTCEFISFQTLHINLLHYISNYPSWLANISYSTSYVHMYIANWVIHQTLTNLSLFDCLFNYGALFSDRPHKMCDQMKITSQPKIVVTYFSITILLLGWKDRNWFFHGWTYNQFPIFH